MDERGKMFIENGGNMLQRLEGQSSLFPREPVGESVSRVSPMVKSAELRYSNSDRVLQSVGHSLHVLEKPDFPKGGGKTPGRSSIVLELQSNEHLRQKITEIGTLPTIPRIYNKIIREFQSETGSLKSVAEIIAADENITSKILKMLNSDYFGLHMRVKNPLHALNLLGFDIIQVLVLFEGVFSQFKAEGLEGDFIERVHNHSLAVGITANKISKSIPLDRDMVLDGFIAGVLHDIGKIIMLAYFPAELNKAIGAARNRSVPLHEVETEIVGITHAFISAYLLTLWGLSDRVVEAVASHHSPGDSENPSPGILAAVHIANAFEHEREGDSIDCQDAMIDVEYLRNSGMLEMLPQLREECLVKANSQKGKNIQAK